MERRSPTMRTWVEVDLAALERNADRIRERNPHRALIGVIKADAYGHGAVPVARVLARIGATLLGVGDSREALELIRAGVRTPMLVLGAIIDGEMEAVVAHDIRTTIHSMGRMHLLAEEARRQDRVHSVHIKVDTGMSRLGMMPEKVLEAVRFATRSPHLRLEGLSTHFANSDLDLSEGTNRQIEIFRRVHAEVVAEVGPLPLIHCRNTAAAWNAEVQDEFSNAIRVGAALYGIPGPTQKPYPFEPIMSLHTQVIFMKDVPAGTPVGYNGRFVTERATRLAVLPVGYHDGLPPNSSSRGFVLIRGEKAPIIGAVSMDYTTVDVTDIPHTTTGDAVLVFGRSELGCLALQELARIAGSSTYAVTCGIGRRVHRVYRTGEEQIAHSVQG